MSITRRQLLSAAATTAAGYTLTRLFRPGLAWAQAPAAYTAGAVAGGVKLAGRVVYEGRSPKPVMKPVTSDFSVAGKDPKQWWGVNAGKDGGLESAIVVIEGIKSGKPFSEGRHLAYAKGAVILERTDVFGLDKPEVLFEVENRDPILHSWQVKLGARTLANVAQPPTPKALSFKVKTLGLHELQCSPHPWERAFRIVVPHPYYARTAADGSFEIGDVPPGTYKVSVWAEGFEATTFETEIKSGAAPFAGKLTEARLTPDLKKGLV